MSAFIWESDTASDEMIAFMNYIARPWFNMWTHFFYLDVGDEEVTWNSSHHSDPVRDIEHVIQRSFDRGV